MPIEIKVNVESFEKIFSNSNVYECPFFQRSYTWTKKNIDKFIDDLVHLEADDDDSIEHYLGAIVVRLDADAPKGLQHPQVWTIIDGQQRLTTTLLIVLSLCELLHAAGVEGDDEQLRERAATYVTQYLMLDPTWPRGREPRVLPTARDYSDLLDVIDRTRKRARVPDESADRFRFSSTFVQPYGDEGGKLRRAYEKLIPTALRERLGEAISDPDTIERTLANLLRRMKVIWVQVPDGADPYEIFHNLNAEGRPLTHGELVKVAVFQRFDRTRLEMAASAEKDWDALYAALGADTFEAFLFPYALCHDQQAKKRELIPALERIWRGWEPNAIIDDLRDYARLYRLLTDSSMAITDAVTDKALAERIRAMRASAPPSSVFPYLMLAVRRALAEPRFADDAARIFWSVETFLLRRQYEGMEPTGLHALFKSLWTWESETATGQSAEGFRARVEENVNIPWVDDIAFAEAVKTNYLYGRRIQRFVLSEFERAHFGDISDAALADMEIDHVAPQTINGTGWADVFPDPVEYARLVNTWGNLIPLTKSGDVSNSAKGRKDWAETRDILIHSVFQTPKHLCAEPLWDAFAIKRRNQAVAAWALKRWPDEPTGSLPKKPKDTAVSQARGGASKAPRPPGEPALSVADLIAKGESETVEFKSTMRVNLHTKEVDPAMEHEVVRTVCALTNARGGTLFIGVDDEGKTLGLDLDIATVQKKSLDGFELTLRRLLDDRFGAVTVKLAIITFPTIDGDVVCRIDVSRSASARFVKSKKGEKGATEFWIRVGNQSQQLQGQDLLEYQKDHWA